MGHASLESGNGSVQNYTIVWLQTCRRDEMKTQNERKMWAGSVAGCCP